MSDIIKRPCTCGLKSLCMCGTMQPMPKVDLWKSGPARQPWERLSCHLIHAPNVDRCTCKQPGLNVGRIAEGEA